MREAPGNNPFGSYSDITAATKEKGHGPFAGDLSLFTFTLYTNATLSHKAGSATFTCQYNFNKNAFCDVSYELHADAICSWRLRLQRNAVYARHHGRVWSL